MNLCIREYLHLVDVGNSINSIKYRYFEGKCEEYINKLEFKEEEFDLDEEWDKFCEKFFNNWIDTGNNFYREVDDWENFSCQFNSKEMIYLIKMVNDYWLETTGEPFDLEEADEEKIWNCIAYAWIRERSDNIKFFILQEIEVKFIKWLEEQKEEEGKHRLTCDICYENKPIETYASCCNDKKFCGRCYKKLKGNPCPFCRGNLDHKVGDDDVRGQTDFQDWLKEMTGIEYELYRFVVKKKIIRRKKDLIEVVLTPFESWKRKMNSIQAELLYITRDKRWNECFNCGDDITYKKTEKFGDNFACLECYNNLEKQTCHLCEDICSEGYEFCSDCLEQEFGMN
jgi:hypothetical protein